MGGGGLCLLNSTTMLGPTRVHSYQQRQLFPSPGSVHGSQHTAHGRRTVTPTCVLLQEPLLRTVYLRTAFQEASNNRVRPPDAWRGPADLHLLPASALLPPSLRLWRSPLHATSCDCGLWITRFVFAGHPPVSQPTSACVWLFVCICVQVRISMDTQLCMVKEAGGPRAPGDWCR